MTMKKTLFILLLLSFAVVVTAQPQHNSKKRGEAVAIGIRGGATLPNYVYPGNPALDTLGFDVLTSRIRPMLGINVEIPLLDGWIYVAPEVDWVGRGDRRLYRSDLWNTIVCYEVRVNYLEARLPVSVAIPATSWLKPYFFAAPTFGLVMPTITDKGPLGSGISQTSDNNIQGFVNSNVAINANNMAQYDFGALAGAGLRFTMTFPRFSLVVKMEAGYYLGFNDTYSEAEHNDQAPAINVNAYNINWVRNNRGLEAAITVALPLKFAPGDACSHWSKGVYPSSKNYNYGF